MSYTLSAAAAVLVAVVVDVFVLRTRVVLGVVFWVAYPIVFGFQLLSNGILTGRHVVVYDPDRILGLRLAYAPVEDLLFGFALVVLTLALWTRLGPSGPPRRPGR